MKSPIVYFGGKGCMYKNIIKYFPEDYKVYVEPFAGSAALFFHKQPSPIEILNDIDMNIYSLYKVLQEDELFELFKAKCDKAIYSEAMRKQCKEILKTNASFVDKAFAFWYVNRTSVNGIGGFKIATNVIRKGISKCVRDFLATIENLPQIHERLSNAIILCTDALKVIKSFLERKDAFLYLDPPYHQSTRSKARYKYDFNDKQHEELINLIMKSKCKILLSGYNNPLYEILDDNGWEKIMFQVNTQDGKRKPKIKTEVLWRNYE